MANEFKIKNGLIIDNGGINATGSMFLSGSITTPDNVINQITSSYSITSSYVKNAESSSYSNTTVSSSYSTYAQSSTSSSYALTASYVQNAVSASFATNAAFASSGDGMFSGSFSGSFQGNGSLLTGITASPGGANTNVQFNRLNQLTGSSDFTFNSSSKLLRVSQEATGSIPLSNVLLQLIASSSQPTRMSLDTHNNNDNFGSSYRARRSRGSVLNPSAILLDDVIMQIVGDGYDGANYISNQVNISLLAAENWNTSSNQGTYIQFRVTPTGTTSSTVPLKLYGTEAIYTGSFRATGSISVIGPITGSSYIGVSGSLKRIIILTTGSTTYTPTAGTQQILVEVIGAGAGGGGADGAPSAGGTGGGGGAGGYAKIFITASISASYSIVIGASGSGGPGQVSGSTGNAGGSSSFGSPIILAAYGGQGGGASGPAASAVLFVTGGFGGGSFGGIINASGSSGFVGMRLTATAVKAGAGADSFYFKNGYRDLIAAGAGYSSPLGQYGCGGYGGCAVGNTDRAGGAGADGVIIIHEFA